MNTRDKFKRLGSLVGLVSASLLLSFPLHAQYLPRFTFWQRPAYLESEDEINLAEIIAQESQFTIFADSLEKAGLSKTLEGNGYLTVLAPTNQAFNALSFTDSQKLSQPEYLKKVLKYHLIEGEINPQEIPVEKLTLAGSLVKITFGKSSQNEFWVNNQAQVIPLDVDENDNPKAKFADNATIVPINKVLLPPEF
ncbi:MAG: hypothetical protein F6K36_09760 [Symploca sp. SIO3C6]|uniref:FAS1 domain-containing protein n=1 Tax=Symploca sp. SIO1C4 TaxID=2607765 RepID=A0A6B3NKG1_9CYAN|nr:hypothetical protein [Symploca sp. SIO3C6]NER32313.1 hypothetical protein [Symploca sp. SIO1C4]NET04822.1 hypothetical protein [Symploca sp. SIO2B6]